MDSARLDENFLLHRDHAMRLLGRMREGLESPGSDYKKLENTDTIARVRRLHEHGIAVIGSSIVGLPHHTVENVREEIERTEDAH